ncbi:hypothetical protein EQ850_04220 [Enterococcus hirae]|nr:hypothetical protein EQ850_04220 [Enterococcus hirae]
MLYVVFVAPVFPSNSPFFLFICTHLYFNSFYFKEFTNFFFKIKKTFHQNCWKVFFCFFGNL